MGRVIEHKVGDLVVNYDRFRKPLSSREREKRKGPYPYYGATCIFDYIDDYIFDGDYILLGEDGTVINPDGSPVLQRISGKTWVNNHAHVLKNTDLIDFDYLYYALKNSKFNGAVTGAVQPKVSQANMNAVVVKIHESIDEQRIISNYLKTIDNKIELNNRINENLEQQAGALFKSWFVDFEPFDEEMVLSPVGIMIPKSMRMVQIGALSHILETGKRPKGGAVAEGIPSVGAESVKRLGVFDPSSAKYIPADFAATLKKGIINGYELLIYKDGGKPGTFTPHFSMFGEGFPYESFFINEHVFKLDFYKRGFNEFAYFYFQTDYPYNWLASNGGKAAIPGINQNDINSIWIYDPSHPKVQEYCEWVQPLFTAILRNCGQNLKLAQLRDSLLPRLMSGELDVSEIDL